MDIGLHYRRVHTHFPAANDAALLRQRYHAIVQLTDRFLTDRLPQPNQRLSIRNLLHADAAKTAIHHVAPYLSL